MIPFLLAAFLFNAPATHAKAPPAPTVHTSRIIRVPARRPGRIPKAARSRLPPQITYRERHGPGCIDAMQIAGAAITAPDAVDFSLKGGQRVRAKLEDNCPALDYYSGFYVSPNEDGRICADRDSIRTRSGGECQIDRFRRLEPIPAR